MCEIPFSSTNCFKPFVCMDSRQGERNGRAGKGKGPYLGVRPRGEKWVSEIRIPKKGKTIWLGSHVSPETAARAYDAASYCLNGETKPFNFPNNKWPDLDISVGSLTIPEIQSIAAQFSCLDISVSSSNPRLVFSPVACQESPELPIANHPHGTNEACFNKVGVAAYAPISSVEIEPCIPTFGVEEPYFPIDKLEIARMLDENPELDEWFCGDRDWIKNLK